MTKQMLKEREREKIKNRNKKRIETEINLFPVNTFIQSLV